MIGYGDGKGPYEPEYDYSQDRMGHYTLTHIPSGRTVYLQGDDAREFDSVEHMWDNSVEKNGDLYPSHNSDIPTGQLHDSIISEYFSNDDDGMGFDPQLGLGDAEKFYSNHGDGLDSDDGSVYSSYGDGINPDSMIHETFQAMRSTNDPNAISGMYDQIYPHLNKFRGRQAQIRAQKMTNGGYANENDMYTEHMLNQILGNFELAKHADYGNIKHTVMSNPQLLDPTHLAQANIPSHFKDYIKTNMLGRYGQEHVMNPRAWSEEMDAVHSNWSKKNNDLTSHGDGSDKLQTMLANATPTKEAWLDDIANHVINNPNLYNKELSTGMTPAQIAQHGYNLDPEQTDLQIGRDVDFLKQYNKI